MIKIAIDNDITAHGMELSWITARTERAGLVYRRLPNIDDGYSRRILKIGRFVLSWSWRVTKS